MQVASYCGILKVIFFFLVIFFTGALESLWKLEVLFPFVLNDITIHSVIQVMNLEITEDFPPLLHKYICFFITLI